MDIDLSTVNWARAQFSLTALYHWLFVPLTLGMALLCAIFESVYVKTGRESWKRLTKFWMTLFGINFAIGVATGIILEFEFGTNWSTYSWMMGDIFGAPLAIEGIAAFFLESTFFAVMFFGWERVSKRFHLFSTWMVAIGSNLSALWILVANAWMQHPVGMRFNPDSVRFEMQDFFAVLTNPVAVAKFTHTTASSYVVGASFVIMVSSWYLFRKRHTLLAKRSIAVASTFGLLASLLTLVTGDQSAYDAAQYQPMKLAAFEGLYTGHVGQSLTGFGILNPDKEVGDGQEAFALDLSIPYGLSILANRTANSFVPGIDDLVYGNPSQNIMGAGEKIARGKRALAALSAYRGAEGDAEARAQALRSFELHSEYMGWGHLKRPEDAVPPVAISFYSFHYMVFAGSYIIGVFALLIWFSLKDRLERYTWLKALGLLSFPIMYLASELGWVVAEVGRQPWVMQGQLLTEVAATKLGPGNVMLTFFIFLLLFTALAVAEVSIMLKQIQIGPEVD